eukprot:475284-Prymnesium_polylepis.1
MEMLRASETARAADAARAESAELSVADVEGMFEKVRRHTRRRRETREGGGARSRRCTAWCGLPLATAASLYRRAAVAWSCGA